MFKYLKKYRDNLGLLAIEEVTVTDSYDNDGYSSCVQTNKVRNVNQINVIKYNRVFNRSFK